MSEEFSEISNQSIRALIQCIVAIGNALKNELPFDYLTPSWHIEDSSMPTGQSLFRTLYAAGLQRESEAPQPGRPDLLARRCVSSHPLTIR